jgi:3-deoxy-D-manno-octulosonate 8-phosphate phosphatase KdsC-like HAD superfamily phosphatase
MYSLYTALLNDSREPLVCDRLKKICIEYIYIYKFEKCSEICEILQSGQISDWRSRIITNVS